MKILMTLTSCFPPDSRVEKEAISLSEEGHEVHIICYSKPNQKKIEKFQNFTIHRIDSSQFFKNKLSALALLTPFYFKKWRKRINKLVLKYNIDAIHVHDLPLSKVGYYFKIKYGCKLVCDQHEFYSNWIKRTAHMNTKLGKMVSFFSNWEKYEKKYLELADLVITVAKPLEHNYLEKYKIKESQIITIPNTPSKNIYNHNNVNKKIIESYKDDFIVFYAGGIDILRGIDTAIKALPLLKVEIPNIKLVLGGRIVKPYDPFKTARLLNVEKYLEFVGWINEKELPSYIAASDVCFFTPPANRDEINKTIATKIYQYAIMGKPVIVSEAKMMKEFVEENNLGVSIKSSDHVAFAESVIKFKNRNLKIQQFIGSASVWEETVKPLCRSYQEIM